MIGDQRPPMVHRLARPAEAQAEDRQGQHRPALHRERGEGGQAIPRQPVDPPKRQEDRESDGCEQQGERRAQGDPQPPGDPGRGQGRGLARIPGRAHGRARLRW